MVIKHIHRALSRLSIQNKFLVINITATTSALLFAIIMAAHNEYTTNRDSIIKTLNIQAKMVGNNATAAIVFNDTKGSREILQGFSSTPEVQVAIMFGNNDKVLSRYIKKGTELRPNKIEELLKKVESISQDININTTGFVFNTKVDITQNIHFENKRIGSIFIRADLSNLLDDIANYLIHTMTMGLIALVIATLLLIKLRKSITQPIQKLTRLMDTVTYNNDYSIRSDNNSSDEIGVLSQNFNKMLSHIQLNDEKLAHELSEGSIVQEHLDKLAYYDLTTDLPNRHFFQERLDKAVERAVTTQKKMVLLFLDLDNFKIVNDTLGHKTGDQLLKQASARLSNVLRRDDYICRVGGDEFAIIIEDIDEIDVTEIVIDKCLDAFSNPFVFDDKKFFIGVSIGASVCPDDATTANSLLVNSDIAMYEAKVRGKNNYQFFSPEMNEAQNKKYQLESELRHAIKKNQLELYYQPQINTRDGKLNGVEALMRWNHPTKGIISPEKFIPVAEETGLILSLGEWLINTACNQGKLITTFGPDKLTIAINISGIQIQEESFIDQISNALNNSGLEPSQLEIELTESTLMEDSEFIINKMKQLQQLGTHISIDDFGTGYSSMSYLKSFPISKLKIDKSFISGLPKSSEDAAITRAIIAMAHGMRIKVVAEGVEHSDQVDFLRSCECDVIQGYYYAKPMTLHELLDTMDQIETSGKKLRVIMGGKNP